MGRRSAYQDLSPRLRLQIQELLDRGVSREIIARLLGVSERTVYRCGDGVLGPDPGPGRAGTPQAETPAGAKLTRKAPRRKGRLRPATGTRDDDEGYPEALLRRVPRDYLAMLPKRHYQALIRAAERVSTAAALRSLRQALLLHGEPLVAPLTTIELLLTKEEEAELGSRGAEVQRSGGAEERGIGRADEQGSRGAGEQKN